MHGTKCAISKLMYGLSVCTDDNHSLKLVALISSRPHISLHFNILLKFKNSETSAKLFNIRLYHDTKYILLVIGISFSLRCCMLSSHPSSESLFKAIEELYI